nr:hypothetical protein [uncultured Methanobacterium sp.]
MTLSEDRVVRTLVIGGGDIVLPQKYSGKELVRASLVLNSSLSQEHIWHI